MYNYKYSERSISRNSNKSEDHNEIYLMAFALKGKVLKIVKETVISTCGRCGIT